MTAVMGIVNVTPDSFSDGGKYFRPEEAVRRAMNLVDEGADIIDLGAESTRPGSVPISWEEEWTRLEPVLQDLNSQLSTLHSQSREGTVPTKNSPLSTLNSPLLEVLAKPRAREGQRPRCPRFAAARATRTLPLPGFAGVSLISVDTYHPETARLAVAAGARIINCVYPEPIEEMLCILEENPHVELIMPASTLNSQLSTLNVEKGLFPQKTLHSPLSTLNYSRVYIDPMIGFGTTREEDLELLRSVPDLAKKARVVVGASRKRLVKKLTGETVTGKNLGGNLGVAIWAAMNGASVVRVHDVRETVQALKVIDAIVM